MISVLKFICLTAAFNSQPAAPPEAARCVTLAESPDSRVSGKPQVAPGPPPMLSFRYYEGKLHHRFSNSDLMLDDAGH